MASDTIGIHELTDEELQRAVFKLRLAGFAPEKEIHGEIIKAAKDEIADLSRFTNSTVERFFQAMVERDLPEIPTVA